MHPKTLPHPHFHPHIQTIQRHDRRPAYVLVRSLPAPRHFTRTFWRWQHAGKRLGPTLGVLGRGRPGRCRTYALARRRRGVAVRRSLLGAPRVRARCEWATHHVARDGCRAARRERRGSGRRRIRDGRKAFARVAAFSGITPVFRTFARRCWRALVGSEVLRVKC